MIITCQECGHVLNRANACAGLGVKCTSCKTVIYLVAATFPNVTTAALGPFARSLMPTKHPNDAAVNAEDAAKLVSDEMVQRACDVYNETPAADGETDLVICDQDAMRAALEAVAATMIQSIKHNIQK